MHSPRHADRLLSARGDCLALNTLTVSSCIKHVRAAVVVVVLTVVVVLST